MLRPLVLAGALALAAPASAVTILFDSAFGLENGGVAVDNYTGFANFTVAAGTVDLVSTCGSSGGLCVRLNPGAQLVANPFALPEEVGVLQLSAAFTNFGPADAAAGGGLVVAPAVNFPIAFTSGVFGPGFGFDQTIGILPFSFTLVSGSINASGAFQGLASFAGEGATTFVANTGTTPFLLESVGASFQAFEFDGGVIPEPGTWAMMIAGFGLVGWAARRRRTAALA